jgi:O-antigen/teichoic acid export membrane protein
LKRVLARQTGSALFWNAIQQVGVNGIFLVRLMILARLLMPEDFGLLAIATTTIGVLSRTTKLGMAPALIQRTSLSRQHYHTAWTVGIVRSSLIAGVVFLGAPVFATIFAEPRSISVIRSIAVVPVIEAAASVRVANLTRELQFRSLAIARLTEAVANSVVAIGLAPTLGVWALVAGTLAGPAAYAAASYHLAPCRPRIAFDLDAARSLIRYGRWIFLTSLIAASGGAVLRVVISRQLGSAELGLYFLAARLAFLPTVVSSQVFGAVAFPLYARLQADVDRVANAFRTIFTGVLVMLMPVFVLIAALASSLVENVLGPSWAGTAPLIRLLAVVGILGLVGDAAVPVFKGLGQPYRFAALEGVQSPVLIASAWWFTWRFDLIGAGLAWFPAIIGSLVASSLFLRRLFPRPFVGLRAPLAAALVASLLGAVIALGIDHLVPGLIGFLLASSLAATVVGATLWLLDRWFHLGLTDDLAEAFPQLAALVQIAPREV